MRIHSHLATMILLLSMPAAALAATKAAKPAPKRPAGMSAIEADTLLTSYAKDRADTKSWLKSSSTSYLATVRREDFGTRTSLTLGSDPGNDIRLQDPGVMARHLRVTVLGDSFHVEAIDPGAKFTVKDKEVTSAWLEPGGIKVGRFSLRLSHQRYPAIIVFDPASPRFKRYKGIRYFPPDLSYHIVAALTPNPNPDTTIILSTRGNRRRAVRVGWFDFNVKGKPCRLEADRLLEPGVGEKDISVFFTDATTGKQSYTVGRYIDPKLLPDGRYVLDFNLCYNPACAYSEHYNCPIPPRANHLTVAIAAGEMDGHYMHH